MLSLSLSLSLTHTQARTHTHRERERVGKLLLSIFSKTQGKKGKFIYIALKIKVNVYLNDFFLVLRCKMFLNITQCHIIL